MTAPVTLLSFFACRADIPADKNQLREALNERKRELARKIDDAEETLGELKQRDRMLDDLIERTCT
jgi:hypothetical protein